MDKWNIIQVYKIQESEWSLASAYVLYFYKLYELYISEGILRIWLTGKSTRI